MKTFKALIVSGIILGFLANPAKARDTQQRFSVKEVLASSDAQAKVDQKILFSFGTAQKHKAAEDFGEFTANKKTNAFNKSDKEACQRAFLSAILSFQDRVRKTGGDAVVEITSYYKKHLVDSPDEFECGAGAVMAGVTLKGRIVKLKK